MQSNNKHSYPRFGSAQKPVLASYVTSFAQIISINILVVVILP